MSEDRNRTGTCYIVVKPDAASVSRLKVVRATAETPRATPEGSVVIKLKLQIPDAAFKPIQPAVTVVIPEDLVHRPVLVVPEPAEDAS